MAVREDANEPKKTDLESLSRSELEERFITETFIYMGRLAKEDSSNPYVEPFNKKVREEYLERTKALRTEIDRRDRLSQEYHNNFIGH